MGHVLCTLLRRYKNYAKTLLGRMNTINGRTYSSDPTIFAWDLLNEARCQGCPPYAISVRTFPGQAMLPVQAMMPTASLPMLLLTSSLLAQCMRPVCSHHACDFTC